MSTLFSATIAGSLPKPAWLSETEKLWPQWKAEGAELQQAKADATVLWIKAQEDAGLDVIGDGEQSRQHFVHGFLEQVEGIDFEHKVKMGIRDNRYDAMVPQVIAELRQYLWGHCCRSCRKVPNTLCFKLSFHKLITLKSGNDEWLER